MPPQVWRFLQQVPNLEKRALAAKLVKDFGSGTPRTTKTLPLPSKEEKVLAARVLPKGEVLVSTEGAVHLLPEGRSFFTLDQGERMENDPEKKMSSRSELSEIRHLDLINNWLVAGGTDGILSVKHLCCVFVPFFYVFLKKQVWNLATSELLSSRQLFGMITGLRCLSEEQVFIF